MVEAVWTVFEPRWPNGHCSHLPSGRWGSIPGRVEMLGSASVNHSLTHQGEKNGTSEFGEDRFHCAGPLCMPPRLPMRKNWVLLGGGTRVPLMDPTM